MWKEITVSFWNFVSHYEFCFITGSCFVLHIQIYAYTHKCICSRISPCTLKYHLYVWIWVYAWDVFFLLNIVCDFFDKYNKISLNDISNWTPPIRLSVHPTVYHSSFLWQTVSFLTPYNLMICLLVIISLFIHIYRFCAAALFLSNKNYEWNAIFFYFLFFHVNFQLFIKLI